MNRVEAALTMLDIGFRALVIGAILYAVWGVGRVILHGIDWYAFAKSVRHANSERRGTTCACGHDWLDHNDEGFFTPCSTRGCVCGDYTSRRHA